MRYQVVILTKSGVEAVEYVHALNRPDAESRAAFAAEEKGLSVASIKAVRPAP